MTTNLCSGPANILTSFKNKESLKSSVRLKGPYLGCRYALLACSMLVAPSLAFAAALPTNGQVIGGNGNISQNGDTMTINQSTGKMVINWDSFSIGPSNKVNFIQPSSSSVALNNVLGSDVSRIQGSLTSNGQVFISNPNGVLFTAGSQVNVGGLVATTLGLSTADFMASDFTFEGASSNAIVNQGNVTTTNGGSIVLIAAKITNTGSLTANGGNVLLGAGRKVVLSLGGPVKLEIEEAAIDALIENGGAIKADGGTVLLTAKAAGYLATTVINNTGTIEAHTLSTNEKGEIFLLGDMENDIIQVGGRLDASAPNGGSGGFVETSASSVKIAEDTRVLTLAANGDNGLWLIDPTDYTVAASGGDITGSTLETNLGGGNIAITTTGAGGNLYINDEVSWSANQLTLTAHNNILVNSDLTATGTASLAFEYGQDAVNAGNMSSYTIASDATVLIPDAANFTWKKGSDGDVNVLYFKNEFLSFTATGEDAIKGLGLDSFGALTQPWYYDTDVAGRDNDYLDWYPLTYSDYPLDFSVGTDGDATNTWNTNGEIITTDDGTDYTDIADVVNSLSIDISGYDEGLGVLTSTLNVNVSETGDTMDIMNTYTLEAGNRYVKIDTSITNNSSTTPLTNARLWVGTRDDYVAENDSPSKFRGNIDGDGFEQIATKDAQSKAIKITENEDNTGAAILFYSTSEDANSVIEDCCDFDNVMEMDPETSEISISGEDGSYGIFLGMDDIAANASSGLTWYYAAAPAAEIDAAATQVAEAAGYTTVPVVEDVEDTPELPPVEIPIPGLVLPPPNPTSNLIVGGVELVNIKTPVDTDGTSSSGSGTTSTGGAGTTGGTSSSGGTGTSSENENTEGGEMDDLTLAELADGQNNEGGFLKVFTVDGGLNTKNEDE